jgi:hypothetical protein
LIPFTLVRARPIAVVALILWLAIRAPGQVQGRVHGLIQDAGGSPVADAQVVAHSSRENTDRAFGSVMDGSFTMDDLNPGHYQFKATKRGFADSPVAEVDLTAGEHLTLNLTCAAASVRRSAEKTMSEPHSQAGLDGAHPVG